MNNMIQFKSVSKNKRMDYLKYLLLADEDEDIVLNYLYDGDLYAIYFEEKLVGVALFVFHKKDLVELKNFAILPEFRGKGIGKKSLAVACDMYRIKGFSKMIVGTANSSINNIAFYQKAGFRMTQIKKDFFTNYSKPIYEHGIRAYDMILFEKQLQKKEDIEG